MGLALHYRYRSYSTPPTFLCAQGRAAILGGKKYGWHYYTAGARARDELAVSVAMSAVRKQLEDGFRKRYNDKLNSI